MHAVAKPYRLSPAEGWLSQICGIRWTGIAQNCAGCSGRSGKSAYGRSYEIPASLEAHNWYVRCPSRLRRGIQKLSGTTATSGKYWTHYAL